MCRVNTSTFFFYPVLENALKPRHSGSAKHSLTDFARKLIDTDDVEQAEIVCSVLLRNYFLCLEHSCKVS